MLQVSSTVALTSLFATIKLERTERCYIITGSIHACLISTNCLDLSHWKLMVIMTFLSGGFGILTLISGLRPFGISRFSNREQWVDDSSEATRLNYNEYILYLKKRSFILEISLWLLKGITMKCISFIRK